MRCNVDPPEDKTHLSFYSSNYFETFLGGSLDTCAGFGIFWKTPKPVGLKFQ